MNIKIINENEVDLGDIGAQIKAELIFRNLMQQPPEIRAVLYRKIMDGYDEN